MRGLAVEVGSGVAAGLDERGGVGFGVKLGAAVGGIGRLADVDEPIDGMPVGDAAGPRAVNELAVDAELDGPDGNDPDTDTTTSAPRAIAPASRNAGRTFRAFTCAASADGSGQKVRD